MQVRALPGPLTEGLPAAWYPVSKTGGLDGLGGSTPSPSASRVWPAHHTRRHGRAGKAARCYRADDCGRSQVRVLLPPSPPRSSAEKSSGFRPHARPFESGRGVFSRCDVVQRQDDRLLPGRCWFDPSRRSLEAAPEPRSSSPAQDTGLSHRRRGFESRSGRLCSRTRPAMRPGCLPGEAGSTPVESVFSP